jgi:hypothetical protein
LPSLEVPHPYKPRIFSFNTSEADAVKAKIIFIENFGSETPSFYDGFTVKY